MIIQVIPRKTKSIIKSFKILCVLFGLFQSIPKIKSKEIQTIFVPDEIDQMFWPKTRGETMINHTNIKVMACFCLSDQRLIFLRAVNQRCSKVIMMMQKDKYYDLLEKLTLKYHDMKNF